MNPLIIEVEKDSTETIKDIKLITKCDSYISNINPPLWIPVIRTTKATMKNTMAAINVRSDSLKERGQR